MDKKRIDRKEEIREILIEDVEWALLSNLYQLPGTKDFVVTMLSECHQSFVEDVKGRLLKKKQAKALQLSINTLIEENQS